MRDTALFGHLQSLAKYIQQVEQSARLGITGESVRNAALQKVLIKKGLITEADLTEAIGEVIREVNTPKPEASKTEEAPKVEIATPTVEQVQEVQKSVIEEPKVNG